MHHMTLAKLHALWLNMMIRRHLLLKERCSPEVLLNTIRGRNLCFRLLFSTRMEKLYECRVHSFSIRFDLSCSFHFQFEYVRQSSRLFSGSAMNVQYVQSDAKKMQTHSFCVADREIGGKNPMRVIILIASFKFIILTLILNVTSQNN